jgi:UDP-N-acetylmuramyl pentapeptide synthase
VLEYGIDHPGEMDFLLSIAQPDIAILTPVESNHLEQFGTLEHYREHKIKLVTWAQSAIVHESLRQYIDRDDVVFYSLGALSDIDASHLEIDTVGTRAIVHFDWQDHSIHISAIWAFQVENILPLYPIAQKLSIDLAHVAKYTLHAPIESGRSVLLSGICDSMIIDGSYNGGYLSIREWVSSMRSFLHSHRIIFFLWDMRELGKDSENIHHRLGQDILDIIPHDADVSFCLVWPMMWDWVAPILDPIYPVETGLSSRELGQSIRQMIEKDKKSTIVYAKWSQNTIFLEEGLKYLLDNPWDEKKLPRQSESWMEKKEMFFRSL